MRSSFLTAGDGPQPERFGNNVNCQWISGAGRRCRPKTSLLFGYALGGPEKLGGLLQGQPLLLQDEEAVGARTRHRRHADGVGYTAVSVVTQNVALPSSTPLI